jgi:methyl-accepting chemotaxis protein
MNSGKPVRKLRNFLLDKRFQLKYTLAVVIISAAISAVLGYFLYQAQQEVFQAERDNSKLLSLDDPELDAGLQEALAQADAKIQQQNRQVLTYLFSFLGGLVLALTLLGIVATHKIAGPAYAMRRTLSAVADGQLPFVRALRRGDELRAVAEELHRMVDMLRQRELRDLSVLRQAQSLLQGLSNVPPETAAALQAVIDEKVARAGEPKA